MNDFKMALGKCFVHHVPLGRVFPRAAAGIFGSRDALEAGSQVADELGPVGRLHGSCRRSLAEEPFETVFEDIFPSGQMNR